MFLELMTRAAIRNYTTRRDVALHGRCHKIEPQMKQEATHTPVVIVRKRTLSIKTR